MARKQKIDLVHISVQRVKELKSEIDSLTKMLDGDQRSAHPKIQDPDEFKANIATKQKELDDHSPKKLRGQNANRMLEKARALETRIRDEMPTSREYFQQPPKTGSTFDFEKAVEQQMAFMRNTGLQRDITAYKNIMRRIDPSDPTLTNIERLRG